MARNNVLVIYLTLSINIVCFNTGSIKLVRLVEDVNRKFVAETDTKIDYLSMTEGNLLAEKLSVFYTSTIVIFAIIAATSSLVSTNSRFYLLWLLLLWSMLNFRTLPMLVWFPYDWTRSLLYELTCAWQYISQIILGMLCGISDVAFACFSIMVEQQFKILGESINI